MSALREWIDHVTSAPCGTDYEIGLSWLPGEGWRVYQIVGDKLLSTNPRGARFIADQYAARGLMAGVVLCDSRAPVCVVSTLHEYAGIADERNATGVKPASVH